MVNTKEAPTAHVVLQGSQGPGAPPELDSPGVKRIEVLSSYLWNIDRVFLFSGIFLVAYVYGLDGQVRGTYQVNLHYLPNG